MYEVIVLADTLAPMSLSSSRDVRLTTLLISMPRIVLAEFNTHRMLSRNSASSRAIPVEKRISLISSDPFIPEAFLSNKRGMQAGDALADEQNEEARKIWIEASQDAIKHAQRLSALGVHKQWANRLLEPFGEQKVIASATDWLNFYNLRVHPDAQPEMQHVARNMQIAMEESTPTRIFDGEWHTPMIDAEDIELSMNNPTCTVDDIFLAKLSVARCARVSYLTHDRGVKDIEADLLLHDRLLLSGHMSPFEHQAMVSLKDTVDREFIGNFRAPYVQYRKMLPNEAVFGGGR